MKKLLSSIVILMFAFCLTGCQDIKDIVNEVENMIIEESLNALTAELGVEGFELPEYEDLSIEFSYDEENDLSKLNLEIVQPDCEFEEYKDQLVGYVEDALSEYVEVSELEGFEPTATLNGYVWEYSYDEVLEDGTVKEVSVMVELIDNNGDFSLNLALKNLGDFFSKVEEEIETETEQNN